MPEQKMPLFASVRHEGSNVCTWCEKGACHVNREVHKLKTHPHQASESRIIRAAHELEHTDSSSEQTTR